MKKFWIIGLILLMITSFLFHIYKINLAPSCFNADEAAFGYNAYSLLKTGRDEYGEFLPLRLKSFGDYKMPLYAYILIPFIKIFGLNEFSVRLPNIIFGILLVPSVFYFAYELFRKKKIALLSSLIFVLSLWPYILSRHAHEAVLCALLLVVSFGLYIHSKNEDNIKYLIFSLLLLLLAQFAYHPARVFGLFYMLFFCIDIVSHKNRLNKTNSIILVVISLIVISPFIIDRFYNPQRVTRLFYTNDGSFKQRIQNAVNEDKNRLLHNVFTESIKTITNNYLRQISYEFLLIDGDKDTRFGMKGMAPMNIIAYILFLYGAYILFRKKDEKSVPLLLLLLFIPLINALTWREPSVGRTYFFIVPFSILSGYGVYYFFNEFKKYQLNKIILVILIPLFIFFSLNSFDQYFNHYPKDKITAFAWQCGYKQAVKEALYLYEKLDQIYVTRRHGQPYIFFLFYGKFDPSIYQREARLSRPDEYGFGQVKKFGKFNFDFNADNLNEPKTMWIGYPEELQKAEQSKLQKIMYNNQHIFSIYSNKD